MDWTTRRNALLSIREDVERERQAAADVLAERMVEFGGHYLEKAIELGAIHAALVALDAEIDRPEPAAAPARPNLEFGPDGWPARD